MTLPDIDVQDTFEYSLLKGHERTDGSFKSDEALKTEYIRLTDNLVHQITNGVESIDSETGERTRQPVDYVVWLDKSARPLSWMIRELWPLLASNENGVAAPEPKHRFVNIDRNQWTSTIDPEGIGTSRVDEIDPSIIRSLRSVFLSNPKDRQNGITAAIDTAPTQFDGKTVLIVDEVRSTGRTLSYAEKFFERAFPQARVATTYWMGNVFAKNNATGNADLPVWYSDKTEEGRGVGNRNIDRSHLSASETQRLGAWFLSVAPDKPDLKSQQLRREIHQLAIDASKGRILVEPSRERDDYEDRALRFNNVDSIGDFVRQRKAQV